MSTSRWKIEGASSYVEGKIDAVMQEIVEIFLAHGHQPALALAGGKVVLKEADDLFRRLYAFEKDKGVAALVAIFTKGLTLTVSKEKETVLEATATLDLPEKVEDRKKYVGMITEWISQNDLAYVERFYRRPTLSQDPADRYLDNPLEASLRLIFGIPIRYRVCITSWAWIEGEGTFRQEFRRILQ